jgi:hypothetical protein
VLRGERVEQFRVSVAVSVSVSGSSHGAPSAVKRVSQSPTRQVHAFFEIGRPVLDYWDSTHSNDKVEEVILNRVLRAMGLQAHLL